MPLLFCLAVLYALMAVQEQLLPGECIFAFLDDVYALSSPERTCAIHNLLEKNCSPSQALVCTLTRPEHSTEQVRSQRAWES